MGLDKGDGLVFGGKAGDAGAGDVVDHGFEDYEKLSHAGTLDLIEF